ncbi:hypothetical protein [Ralstonia solanacearum]|uniref:hypothetical protein n=1 Tax=Ralstonia solanacearum TaxID=305 RepID=UPI0001D94942|nr:hypothetical protein [Ralstonia solanacearum]CBJ43570.1 protein of unknown function [Ralstonia solanacearum CFBP2957]
MKAPSIHQPRAWLAAEEGYSSKGPQAGSHNEPGDNLLPHLIALTFRFFVGWPNIVARPPGGNHGNPILQDVHRVNPRPARAVLLAPDSNNIPLNLKNSLATIDLHGTPSNESENPCMSVEHPTHFSGVMVRAPLDAAETQTRRHVTSVSGLGQVTEFQRSEAPGYGGIMRDKHMRWRDLPQAAALKVMYRERIAA